MNEKNWELMPDAEFVKGTSAPVWDGSGVSSFIKPSPAAATWRDRSWPQESVTINGEVCHLYSDHYAVSESKKVYHSAS